MTDNPMKIKRVFFQIGVDDLIRAKDFYTQTFNFEVGWYLSPEVGWCELKLPGSSSVGLNTRNPEEKKQPSWGILTIEVENIEETHAYFTKIGLNPSKIIDLPQMVSYFNIKDPEENTVQIVADPRINE